MLQQLIISQQTPQNSHPRYTGGWLTRERRATLPPCVPFWVLETHHTILCFGAFTLAVNSASFAFSMKRTPWFSKATQKCPLSSPSCPVNSGLGTPLSYLTTSCTHSFHSTEHFFFYLWWHTGPQVFYSSLQLQQLTGPSTQKSDSAFVDLKNIYLLNIFLNFTSEVPGAHDVAIMAQLQP